MSIDEMDRILQRFHGALLAEIRAKRPEYLDEPFTVAEIYQTFVPYGTHRDRIGVDMNGDYEDALLRLLAGEGDYLLLESEPALKRLQAELDSPSPNTGIYREFAAVDVRLNPAHARVAPGPARPAPPTRAVEEDAAISIGDLAPAGDRDHEAASRPEPSVPPSTCRWCRAELPAKPSLKYCPFCGTDVRVVPCPGCGEELEPEWRFCIACGAEVREG